MQTGSGEGKTLTETSPLAKAKEKKKKNKPKTKKKKTNNVLMRKSVDQVGNPQKNGLAGNRTPDHSHAKGVLYH